MGVGVWVCVLSNYYISMYVCRSWARLIYIYIYIGAEGFRGGGEEADYVCVCVCVYICILFYYYIYMYIHTYIHAYICMYGRWI